ncbi:MAG: polysaccharide deacetylase family protein [Oscillospiraceae bacterium]|nr:polysaccharide deacetylase family protein [Oscillospiraceae bacterium]
MKIAITFDDGPSVHTTCILNTLQQNEGVVSFFVMGSKIEEHKGKIYRASQMGCEIICHTWEHVDFTKLSKRVIKKHLVNTISAIAKITGDVTHIFRPPYGNFDEKVEKVARKLGLSMVNWSVDPKDWECKDEDMVYSIIMNEVKEGDIILCHDIYDSTAKAMSRVIPDLIAQGYELVTVSELLREKYGELEPGRMYWD